MDTATSDGRTMHLPCASLDRPSSYLSIAPTWPRPRAISMFRPLFIRQICNSRTNPSRKLWSQRGYCNEWRKLGLFSHSFMSSSSNCLTNMCTLIDLFCITNLSESMFWTNRVDNTWYIFCIHLLFVCLVIHPGPRPRIDSTVSRSCSLTDL